MQSTNIQNYINTFNQILNLSKTCNNIATLQNLISQLDAQRIIVLQSQSDTSTSSLTDKEQYDVHIIRSLPFNKITCFGFLVECYNDFDNKLSSETDPDVINTLTIQKLEFKETLKTIMSNDLFCCYFSSLVRFVIN